MQSEQRFISMQLIYRPEIVPSHESEGWIAGKPDPFCFGEAEDWGKHNDALPNLESGFHV